jgi:hypothetical protein
MKPIRYIIRAILLLWTILWLIYLNVKTNDNIELAAQYKYEIFDKLMGDTKMDSLNRKHNLTLLDAETTKFTSKILEDSSHIKEAILYLLITLAFFFAIELSFFLFDIKQRQSIKNIQ